MIYLLDTDIVVYMLRGLKSQRSRQRARRQRALKIVARCKKEQGAGQVVGISAITLSELEHGARKSVDYAAEIRAVRRILTPFRVFEYDAIDAPPQFGRIRFELETAGVPIGAMDLLIAAHAVALDATLVSNNTAHFRRISGLVIENWA